MFVSEVTEPLMSLSPLEKLGNCFSVTGDARFVP